MNPTFVSATVPGLLTPTVSRVVAPGAIAAGLKLLVKPGAGLTTLMSSFVVEAAA